jgi:hypothetical protein
MQHEVLISPRAREVQASRARGAYTSFTPLLQAHMQVSHARALMQPSLARGKYCMQASRALGTCASSHARGTCANFTC